MEKTIKILLFTLLLFAFNTNTVSALGDAIISQTSVPAYYESALCNGKYVAQSFTMPAGETTIGAIKFYQNRSSTQGTFYIEVYSGSTINFTTIIGTSSSAQFPNGEPQTFTFSPALSVTASSSYHFLVRAYGTCQFSPQKDNSNPYSGGNAYYATNKSGEDYGFIVYKAEPVCGNSIVESPEVCDENYQSCEIDGYEGIQWCNANCYEWDDCTTDLSCGDGIINGDEECDDDNNTSYDGCENDCTTSLYVLDEDDDLLSYFFAFIFYLSAFSIFLTIIIKLINYHKKTNA